MRNDTILAIHLTRQFKALLQLEAWEQRLTLSQYTRNLLERSRTPDGKPRRVAEMRMARGRPRKKREE